MVNSVPLLPAIRQSLWRSGLPVSLAPFLLVGCTQAPPSVDPNVLLPPVAPAAKKAKVPAGSGEVRAAAPGANLAPLATPQQVVGAVDLGRLDPFGSLVSRLPTLVGPDGKPLPGSGADGASAAAGSPGSSSLRGGAAAQRTAGAAGSAAGAGADRRRPPLQLPNGFSVSGVIRSGGLSEAVVSYGALSGSLRPGDRGGRTTDLLPSGWSVASIDVNRGLITLQKDGQRVSAEL